jgi:phytoene dehydrogenase-like protein
MPVRELAQQKWDVIVVGAGHNGLTCATYLARGGKKVLVLEARARVGGACTLEEVWPGVRMSPCAYLAGPLHPLVIDELDLPSHGFEWTNAAAGLFTPFDDGSCVQLYDDDDACEAEVRRFAPKDVEGWRAMKQVLRRTREAIRPVGERDMWLGRPPTREQIEDRIGNDDEARNLLFNWSMAEYCERYLQDERMQLAYFSQGVIGTNASPFHPGTAFIRFHHETGRINGTVGTWGYVTGGMGMVSFMLCDIAREHGVTVAAGVPVARIVPGQGVVLMGGERVDAPIVVSNADPVVTQHLLGDDADAAWSAQVQATPIKGCTVKLNMLLRELPSFKARPGTLMEHHYGQIDTSLTKQQWRAGFAAAQRGELPEYLWTELYFQTVHDQSVISKSSPHYGAHTMSVFAQYVPYAFAHGTWDSRRDEVKQLAVKSLARFIENFPAAIIDIEVLGPPDIENKVGLTGGHIFQGECLPPYMWSNRLAYKTPMPGVYLCGACTHPGGSVIAINGRNAAMEILGN